MDPLDSSLSLLQQQAIDAALTCQWQQALDLNKQIIDLYPENVDAINRYARAHFELGDLSESKRLFELSLKHDPYNQIAAKFIKRIAAFKSSGVKPNGNGIANHILLSSDLFIKEPGKSKLVNLLKVAEPQKLSLLSTGEEVTLNVKNHSVSVTDYRGNYLGTLPDDISHRLIRFIRGGNKYQAIIKSIKPNALTLLIKEAYRCSRFKNQPSFPETTNFTYSSEHISINDDESPTEGEEEGEEEAV